MRKLGDKTVVNVKAGRWYALAFGGKPYFEECCDCGLVHRARLKAEVKDGQIRVWIKWDPDEKQTRIARRRPQRFTKRA
jgi:Zn-finger protein